jgi:hypothetical protein
VYEDFIIYIDSVNTLNPTRYPTLDLPRGRALDKEEIKIAVENRAFSSSMTKINTNTEFVYASLEQALNELEAFAGVNKLCFSRYVFDRESGNMRLWVGAIYENEHNSCISGSVDLITGEKKLGDSPCTI